MTQWILVKIVIAIAPAFICIVSVVQSRSRELSKRRLLGFSVTGMLIVIPVFFLEGIVSDSVPQYSATNIIFRSCVVSPVAEETAKFLLIAILLIKFEPASSKKEGGTIGLVAGSGFALAENLFYLTNPTHVLILRSLTVLPLHMALSMLYGGAFAQSRLTKKPFIALVYFLASLIFHGAYNLFLSLEIWPAAWLISGLSVITIMISSSLVNRSTLTPP